ncbi:MAG: CDP-alcohol phosphatidyltransferase family protein [Gammaproteobacteria bacterium]
MISRRDIPNILTILRILLVAPIVVLMVEERYLTAMALFAVAGISDGLDGYLAKRNGWVTRLGSFLDPLADKVLLVCSYVTLGWNGLLPWWLVALVIGRDLLILGGAAAFRILVGRFNAEPTLVSKTNTFAQIVLVLAVVFDQLVAWSLQHLVEPLLYVVAATTIASGVGYVWEWGRRALRRHQQV